MTAVCAKLDHTAYAIKLRYAEGLGMAEHAISRGTVPPEVQDVDPGCAALVKRWSRRGLERRPPEMHYFLAAHGLQRGCPCSGTHAASRSARYCCSRRSPLSSNQRPGPVPRRRATCSS